MSSIWHTIVIFAMLGLLAGFNPAPVGATEQGVTINYFVEITPASAAQHTAHVKMNISGVGSYSTIDLTISSGPGPGGYESRWISIQKCYSVAGNKQLRIEQLSSTSWKVYTDSSDEVAIEYDALLKIPRSASLGAEDVFLTYLGENCGVVYAEALLLRAPFEAPFTTEFSLPTGWRVLSDESWTTVGTSGFTVAPSGFGSYLAIGPWEIYRDTFGENQRLTVALCGSTRYPKEEYIRNIKVCVDYFTGHIGKLYHDDLKIVLAPLPLPGDFSTGNSKSAIRIERADTRWGFFEAALWHHWFLFLGPELEHEQHEIWWFGESASPFFFRPIYKSLGAPVAEWTGLADYVFLGDEWDGYRNYEKYIGTRYDIPVTDYIEASQRTSDDRYYTLMYMKGNAVLHCLDVAIAEATQGTKSLEDIIRYLYDNYLSKGVGFTNEDVLSAVNEITGVDFKTFFDAYVYGNERLPVLSSDGNYADNFLAIWEKIYPSLPNAEKLRPFYSSKSVNLELKKESKHFTIYFHPKDSAAALMLLCDAERIYPHVANVYGGELKLKVKIFLTYDGYEFQLFGGEPPFNTPPLDENTSSGGVATAAGDEICWYNPIRSKDLPNRMLSKTGYEIRHVAHEVGHTFLKQNYLGIFFPGIKDFSEIPEFIEKGLWGKKWLSWVDESLAGYASTTYVLDTFNDPYEVPNRPPCFVDTSALNQLVESCQGGSPPLLRLRDLENFRGDGSSKERLLSEAEGITFVYFIYFRYGENGAQRLLSEWSNNNTFFEAAEKAFGLPFGELERQWMEIVSKATANLDRCDAELSQLMREGVNIDNANKLRGTDLDAKFPLLALLNAYASEERCRELGLLLPVLSPGSALMISIKPDAPARIGVEDTAITSLEIRVSKEVRGAGIALREVASPAVPAPSGVVYRYIEITKENIADADVSSVEISFEIEKSWFEEKNIDAASVVLNRCAGDVWTSLQTTKTGEDAARVYYTATSPGFSIFAISGTQTAQGPEIPAENPAGSPSEVLVPAILVISILALLPVFLIARRKRIRSAKVVGIALLVLIVLLAISWNLFLVIFFLTPVGYAVIIVAAILVIRGRKRKARV